MPAPLRPTGQHKMAPPSETISNAFPTSSRVATSESPRQPLQDTEDFAQVGASSSKRAVAQMNTETLQKRLEWVENLCEPGTSLSLMKEALHVLDRMSYEDLLHERHSMEICPYPPCTRNSGIPYQAGQSTSNLKVRFTKGVLFDASDSEKRHGAYCSRKCQARSEWYQSLIGTERTEMLEDVEVRRREVGRSATVISEAFRNLSTHHADTTEELERVLGRQPSPYENHTMLSALTIHERPLPTQTPIPPNMQHPVDFERPQAFASSGLPNTALRRAPTTARNGLSPPSTTPRPAFDYSSLTAPVTEDPLWPSTSSFSKVQSSRQPVEGIAGLPPPVWTSDPIMVQDGQEVEWRKELDEDIGEDAIQMREWLDAALEERARAKRAGEMP